MWMQTKNLQQNMVRNIPTVLIFHNGEVVEASRSSSANLR
jgi:hypothetical protein